MWVWMQQNMWFVNFSPSPWRKLLSVHFDPTGLATSKFLGNIFKYLFFFFKEKAIGHIVSSKEG